VPTGDNALSNSSSFSQLDGNGKLSAGAVFRLALGGRFLSVELYVVSLGVCVHEVLECKKPGTVGLGFSQKRDCRAAVNATHDAFVRRELLHTVDRAIVQAASSVRLSLQPNADVLNWCGKKGVANTSKRTRSVVLPI
jgi:hypothetical protein